MGMLPIKLRFVIIFIFTLLLLSYAQRRIRNGNAVTSDKKYVVYLLKAPASPQKYDTWLCGGALVSAEYIITSAACVEDVQHLYAIAGYKKYIGFEMLNLDPCTREKKKKIVFICVPKNYDLVYERLEKWSYIDIAVVKVESPYDFHDRSYESICSYVPAPISVNFEQRFQEPGVETLTYGWGHTEVWRTPNDAGNYNQENLRYASALILDKNRCKSYYTKFVKMDYIIDKYMICTMDPGNFNDAGELILKEIKPGQLMEGCITRMQRMRGLKGKPCAEPTAENDYYNNNEDIVMIDNTRREDANVNKSVNYRRNGICQNDHGGPLVTWVGSREVLIGVASVFRVNAASQCEGPYLFTSTQCNGAFLDCILNTKPGRRTSCDAPPDVRGFDKTERYISWFGHPDGPAENEIKKPDEQPVRTQQTQQQQSQAQQLRPVLSISQRIRLQELRKRKLLEQQREEQQAAKQQLKVDLEQHTTDPPSSEDIKLSELLSPDVELSGSPLPGAQLTEQQSAGQQFPEQQSAGQQLPRYQFDRPIFNDGRPSAEQDDTFVL